jgi:hypothetical protein
MLHAVLLLVASSCLPAPAPDDGLRLSWQDEILTIRGPDFPGESLDIWYIEAFCRPGSTERDWHETVIPHETQLMKADPDGRSLLLRSTLEDGVIVDHQITAGSDRVDFLVTATNPTDRPSMAHWAQPCIRVDRFTGVPADRNSEAYLAKSFVFIDGKAQRLPTEPWATEARYTPGQVWCPSHVPRSDVNPRPLSDLVPSNGLIGCYSADGSKILATAWEPYQELFQGIIVCLHSDFRIGGLEPGESKRIKGVLYLGDANLDHLLDRYRADFPEHAPPEPIEPDRE